MKTKKQQELIETYLSQLENKDQTIYRELIVYLSELGYNHKKKVCEFLLSTICTVNRLQKRYIEGANNQDRYLCCGFPLVKITLRDLRIL